MSATIKAALRSGKGCVRPGNEDCWYFNGHYPEAVDRMNEEASRADAFPGDGALFAVCDGVGGASSGEVASWTAVSLMKELQLSLLRGEARETIRSWTEKTNAAVLDATMGGGSTLAMVYVRDRQALVGHIGDSRVYLLREGALTRLTRDHSQVQVLMDAGLITKQQALTHPQRHVILRSLGMNEEDGPCECALREPLSLRSGDRLLLCSDGVTDMLTDDALCQLLSAGSPDDCAGAIYHAALEHGGVDNTTLIVLEYQTDEPEEQPSAVEADPSQEPAEEDAQPAREDAAGRPKRKRVGILAAAVLCLMLAICTYYVFIRTAHPSPDSTPAATTFTPVPTRWVEITATPAPAIVYTAAPTVPPAPLAPIAMPEREPEQLEEGMPLPEGNEPPFDAIPEGVEPPLDIIPEGEELPPDTIPPEEEQDALLPLLPVKTADVLLLPAAETPAPTEDPSLSISMLVNVQTRLLQLGYMKQQPTGKLDRTTAEALRSFQRQHGLPVTGEADEATCGLLLSVEAQPFATTAPQDVPLPPQAMVTVTAAPTREPLPYDPASLLRHGVFMGSDESQP